MATSKERRSKIVTKRAKRPPRPPRVGEPLTVWDLSRDHRLAPIDVATKEHLDAVRAARSKWIIDLAWDGHRVLAFCLGKRTRLVSSDFREWHDVFPTIGMALERLVDRAVRKPAQLGEDEKKTGVDKAPSKDKAEAAPPKEKTDATAPTTTEAAPKETAKDVILEGWICALGPEGLPSFDLLRLHAQKQPQNIVFAVWDLLRVDGEDLRSKPLSERRARLVKLLAERPQEGVMLVSESLHGSVEALVEGVRKMGARGIVLREADALYPTDPKPAAMSFAVPCPGKALELDRVLSPPPVVTNQDKLMFPRDGISKKDVVAYYNDIAPIMLPYLKDRPIIGQRWPDGIDDFTWYQHRMPPRAPDYLRAVWIEGNRRICIEHTDGLLWLANQAVLTVHGWASRISTLANPDWVVIDLDPGSSTTWPQVIEVAVALRKLFELLELPSFPKTSGQKGIHVLVPIAPGQSVIQAHELARRVGKMLVQVLPHLTTLESSIEARGGRLYIDHLQNFVGKSLVLPYSLRATDGAPVSTPLLWSEITPKLDPKSFNLRTLRKRLDEKGDLASTLLEGTVRLNDVIGKMER